MAEVPGSSGLSRRSQGVQGFGGGPPLPLWSDSGEVVVLWCDSGEVDLDVVALHPERVGGGSTSTCGRPVSGPAWRMLNGFPMYTKKQRDGWGASDSDRRHGRRGGRSRESVGARVQGRPLGRGRGRGGGRGNASEADASRGTLPLSSPSPRTSSRKLDRLIRLCSPYWDVSRAWLT